jgi:hypothetical protein
LKIGVVSGDNVLELVRAVANTSSPDFQNLDTNAKLHDVRDRLVTANAYLGAPPIVEALAAGADIVITGRVADPSLVVAPCIHHFSWNKNELDRLAGATIAGHLVECGTQVTGGISTDWLDVPDAARIGFPIVEVSDDGSCIVTKPGGTGGRVTEMTVKEQLLYEIGDPDNYLSPDVTVSFLKLAVEDLGNDRVGVSGATGKPRPEMLKVSATFRDGFRAAGTLTIIGRNARAKARRVGTFVLQRVHDAGFTPRDTIVETISSVVGSDQEDSPHPEGIEESVLRVAVEANEREAVERFSRELMPYITAGPQGTTGYAEGRPRVHQVFRYWPCLISQDAVAPQVKILSGSSGATKTSSHAAPFSALGSGPEDAAPLSQSQLASVKTARKPTHLYDIAVARSGDKGTSANIGVIVRRHDWWQLLEKWLTADAVATYFAPMGIESVERFELPNLGALNFVIRGALRRSLRTDAQGKALGQILLEMPLPEDATK